MALVDLNSKQMTSEVSITANWVFASFMEIKVNKLVLTCDNGVFSKQS